MKWLKTKEVENIIIVGLNRSVSQKIYGTESEEIVKKIAENYHGIGYVILFFSFVDDREIAASIMKDSRIVEVFELIEQAWIAVFSVENLHDDSVLIRSGYFQKEEYQKLREQGYLGDVCSRYFKENDFFERNELYERVIGIDLKKLIIIKGYVLL